MPPTPAKILYVEDPQRWKDGGKIFFALGYGYGTDPGRSVDCDDGHLGTKRVGRFGLTRDTPTTTGSSASGTPSPSRAVDAGWYRGTSLCRGDSGGPWTIAVGGAQNAEKLVFALTSGLNGNRSAPWLGFKDWGTLLTAKLGFVRDTSRARGLPIVCTTRTDLGYDYRYRQCTEGAAVPPQGGGGGSGDDDDPPTHEN